MMAGVIPAATLDHKVTLRLKVKYKDGEAEGWKGLGLGLLWSLHLCHV